MKDLFVTYELGLKLKAIGFDESCISYWEIHPHDQCIVYYDKPYNNSKITNSEIEWCYAPLYTQVIDWFDKTHKIRIGSLTNPTTGKYRFEIVKHNGKADGTGAWERLSNPISFFTSVERDIKAIDDAIKLISDEKN